MLITTDKKFKKVSKYPSWVTPEVIAYYESKDGNKHARLSYGLVGENLDLWGVEIADVYTKEMLTTCAFTDPNSAFKWLKTKLK